jgi:hypothetical protein
MSKHKNLFMKFGQYIKRRMNLHILGFSLLYRAPSILMTYSKMMKLTAIKGVGPVIVADILDGTS